MLEGVFSRSQDLKNKNVIIEGSLPLKGWRDALRDLDAVHTY